MEPAGDQRGVTGVAVKPLIGRGVSVTVAAEVTGVVEMLVSLLPPWLSMVAGERA